MIFIVKTEIFYKHEPENLYQAWVQVTPGPNTLTIEATDYAAPTPNVRTKSWSLNITSPPARSFSYDTNGNTLSDGLRTYQWDAEDRLVKITQGVNVYEFIYDGHSRRVAEKLNGIVTKRFLWDGPQIADQRDATGTTIQRRYYSEGEQCLGGSNAGNYYYTRDHLGSIRELTDSTATVRARYDYDPYGKRTKLTGDLDCDFAFTGHYYHTGNNLHLTLYRAYDQELGRWLSVDPIRETGGLNLYRYVENDPLNQRDPLGLSPACSLHNPFGPGSYKANRSPDMTDAYVGAGMLTVGLAGGAIAGPATAYHFTSAAGYASIMSNGVITAGSGLFGRGVYVSAVNSALLAKLMGAQSTEKCIKVATEGLNKMPTLIPGAYRIMQDVTSKFFR